MDLFPNRQSFRFLLIADQFEELYTLIPATETRHRFLDLLLAAINAETNTVSQGFHLLLTLRADFLSQTLRYPPFGEALQDNVKLLSLMTAEELRRAIERPAARQGAFFEPGLVERILSDVSNEPGSLPLLEFSLTELWNRQERGQLTHATYEAIGKVEGALAHYADQVYNKLTADQQVQARRVFTQLVHPGAGTEDTRRLATRAELTGNWSLVQHLADRRLVVTNQIEYEQEAVETAEVVHEALIRGWEKLGTWMDQDRTFRTWQDRLRAALVQWEVGQDEWALLRDVPLAEAEEWLAERPADLSEAEKTFIQTSIALREAKRARRKRNRTLVIAVAVVIALIMTGLAWFGLDQSTVATDQKSTAEVASTLAIIERDNATTSEAIAQSEAQNAATAAAQSAQDAETARRAQAAAETAEAKAETARLETEYQARIGRSRELMARTQTQDDGKGSLSLMLAREAVLTTWIADGRVITSPFILPQVNRLLHQVIQQAWHHPWKKTFPWRSRHTASVNAVAFSPDGQQFVSGGDDQTIRLWEVGSGKQVGQFDGHAGSVISVAFSPRWAANRLDGG